MVRGPSGSARVQRFLGLKPIESDHKVTYFKPRVEHGLENMSDAYFGRP
jgi:hypothetical protein